MKILAWNCRGMVAATAVRELLELQERVGADVIFLSESHLNIEKAGELWVKLGFDLVHEVASDGRSGGLALFCNNTSGVVVNFKTENYIDVVLMSGDDVDWRLTCFYGEPAWDRRHLSWQYLRDLKGVSNSAWMVIGDLNEILYGSEKDGGNPRPGRMMQAFRDCLFDCSLIDMEFIGDKFTWRRGEIRERLDRAVCNEAWSEKFPLAVLSHEPHVHSDHRPLLLDTEYYDGQQLRKPSGGRKFEARWLNESTVDEIVKSA